MTDPTPTAETPTTQPTATADPPRRPRDRQQVPSLYSAVQADVELAEDGLRGAKLDGTPQLPTADFHLRRAQVNATLLLANETRVSNLISLLAVLSSGQMTPGGIARLKIVEDRVNAALGLESSS